MPVQTYLDVCAYQHTRGSRVATINNLSIAERQTRFLCLTQAIKARRAINGFLTNNYSFYKQHLYIYILHICL